MHHRLGRLAYMMLAMAYITSSCTVDTVVRLQTFGQSRVSEINTRIKALHDGGSQSADEASEPSTSSQASLKIARSFSHCL